MGKHSGPPAWEDPNSPENAAARDEIKIDISDERAQADANMIDEAYGEKA